MLLTGNNLKKSFVESTIIENGSFFIEDREKVALVGPNGAGKSTLLKIIINELEPDAGEVILAKGKTIGYLAQHQDMDTNLTIYEEVAKSKEDIILLEQQIRALELELKSLTGKVLEERLSTYNHLVSRFEVENGYALESEITGVLKGLGFSEEEFTRKISTLSGGQKTRVALGGLLLKKPDLLLLDEPTNHLDLTSISWLETYLINYSGAVLVVSHDRYFLNRVVTKVLDLDNGVLHSYKGNYDAFSYKKAEQRKARINAYLKQQDEIKHQEEVIEKLKSFNREKSIKRAESREKLLKKIKPLEKPAEMNTKMSLHLAPETESGKDVLEVLEIAKTFGNNTLFKDLSFEIKKGEHVALIGDNGTGKTTILKMINGLLPPDTGKIILGSNVYIGYYDQEYHVLHDDKTIFAEIADTYPAMTISKIRNMLAAFLFTGDDVYKQIKSLSGGEKGRISLAKLMLSKSNFLILDEPTNHLDMDSKEILEAALNDYSGTVFYVSHDRYFINKTASRILDLSYGTITNYLGNYDYYLEKKDELSPKASPNLSASDKEENEGKLSWQEQKELKAKEQKRLNDLKKCEETIFALEKRNEEIDQELLKEEVYTNSLLLQDLTKEKNKIEAELEALYLTWEELQEL